MKTKVVILFWCFIVLSSCQTTGVFIREVPISATDVRKGVVTVIGEPRNTSTNGRELISRYHDKVGNFDDAIKANKERRFTKVTILGDRRPFDVQVEVFIEQKTPEGFYEVVEQDDRLAQEMAAKIKKALHQGLEKRNMIDDFRAF